MKVLCLFFILLFRPVINGSGRTFHAHYSPWLEYLTGNSEVSASCFDSILVFLHVPEIILKCFNLNKESSQPWWFLCFFFFIQPMFCSQTLKKKFLLHLFTLYSVWMFCLHVYGHCLVSPKVKSHQIPWNWNCERFSNAMWKLRIKPRSSVKALKSCAIATTIYS